MQTNKVAIVTGASKGIGRSVAQGLAEDGYNLVLIARTESKLIELAEETKAYGIKTQIICADITDFTSVCQAVAEIISTWGRVDILVNNAGIFKDGTLQTSNDDYQELFYTNFKAPLMLLKTVIPFMQKQKNGYIFNIASIAGKTGYSGKGAYASSKFALVGLSESLYHEYSNDGIKITAICPGFVATDMAKGAPISTDEMIQPEDILKTIRWLLDLSPSAFVKEIILNTAK